MVQFLHRFDAEFSAALKALADQAEANLGLSGTRFAMVCHHSRQDTQGWVYEATCAGADGLVREMRRGFPRRGKGGQRFFIKPLGALFLVDVRLADVTAARAAITPA